MVISSKFERSALFILALFLCFVPALCFAEDAIVDFDEEFEDEGVNSGDAAGTGGSAVGGDWFKDKLHFNLRLDFGLKGVLFPNRSDKKLELTFDQNHHHFLVNGTLKDILTVQLDLTNSFNQITLHAGSGLDLYFGKILVPFGNIEQHPLYGGRVEEVGSFLPITWSNLGVGVRTYIAQRRGDLAMYVLNGFPEPTDTVATFSYMATAEDNALKAFGLRYQHRFTRNFSLTASILSDFPAADNGWNDHIFMYGLDTVIKLKAFTLKAGSTLHEVYLESAGSPDRFLLPASYLRTGSFVETRYDLSEKVALRLRFGHLDRNSQLRDAEDEINVGPGLILNFGVLDLITEYNLMMHTYPSSDYKGDNYQNTLKITAVINI